MVPFLHLMESGREQRCYISFAVMLSFKASCYLGVRKRLNWNFLFLKIDLATTKIPCISTAVSGSS